MKELEHKDQIEIREEQQQKKEIKLIGSQLRVKGHTLFEFNARTKELSKAMFKTETLEIITISKDKSNINSRLKVVVNDDCFYIQSLNEKNARKKLSKLNLL
jgi:hypothetical protein